MTTNDVDGIFREKGKIGGPPFGCLCETIGLRDASIPQPEIRQYAFDRLLALQISTNTPRLVASIRANADHIESAEFMFGMKLGDRELRKILQNVQRHQPLPTDDLEAMGNRAVAMYKKKYPQRARFYVNGMRREFIDEWMWHRDRVIAWNREVAEYRRKLVDFVCRKYHEIHADEPEKSRTGALERLLGEYGFRLPEAGQP